MEVLLEYRGTRRQLTVSSGESLSECISGELRRVGRTRAVVHTATVTLDSTNDRDVYILQKWSPQWNCFVDVRHLNEVNDGDRLTVVGKPKPPSKIIRMLCCCISTPDFGVRQPMQGVSKNEEIQAMDYKFKIETETASNWDSQSVAPIEELGDDDSQYVRDTTGRAAWKMVPKSKQETSNELQNDENSEEHIEPEDHVTNSSENDLVPVIADESNQPEQASDQAGGDTEQATGGDSELASGDTDLEQADGVTEQDGGDTEQASEQAGGDTEQAVDDTEQASEQAVSDTDQAGGDTEQAGGDTEQAGGDTEQAGGDTEQAGGDTEQAVGDTEQASGTDRQDIESPTELIESKNESRSITPATPESQQEQ